MAKVNEAIMEMVKSELAENPDASSSDLYDKARKMNRAIGRLTLRQFHARYPLQVKRLSAARKRKRSSGTARRGQPGRAKTATGTRRKRGARRRSASAAAETRAPAPAANARANVQEVLLQFAGVVATADKADMVQLMLRMDAWVDRVIEAAS